MNKFLNSRYVQILTLIGILMLILLIRLFVLTVIENDKWQEAADSNSTRKIYTAAPRGEILDKYGNVLAGNKHTFSVQMSRGDADDKVLNEIISNLIKTFEDNGDKYYDNLPIKISSSGEFYYTYDKEKVKWQKSENIPLNYTAREAYDYLKSKLGISAKTSDTDAQIEMQNVYNTYPEISITKMEYSADVDKATFLERYGLDPDLSAKDAFKALRKKLKLNDDLSDAGARKILVVRNELAAMGYRTYMPTTLAKNVSDKTIVLIEEESDKYRGVEVASETKRYYPNGSTAAHIIGYLGAISESEKEEYIEQKGYQSTDLVGKDGIEGAYEDVLRGKDGTKTVQVDAAGNLTDVVSETDPQKGKDIYLTIDLKLQKSLEKALKQGVDCTRYGGTFESKYGNFSYSRSYGNCKSGAAVAIDVKTGDVLAMASYPSYDPNLFAEGITAKAWASVQSENKRDPLAAAPLYNIATKSAVQPGSTFKPVTATAALDCGLDPNQYLTDAGAIKIGNLSFGCWLWNETKGTANHGAIDLETAIETSCNYYFFDVGTGKDWASGGSDLGYDKKISIDVIMDYAKQYGLGKKTGIEIPETVTKTATKASKIESVKTQLKYLLEANAETYFEKSVSGNADELERQIAEIVGWTDKGYERQEIIDKMGKLGIKKSKVTDLSDLCKYTYFAQATWNTGDQFNISIGQGTNAYTPLQMANYTATLANKGVHNDASVVDTIEGQGKVEKAASTKVNVKDDSYFDYIINGMKRVCTGSQGSITAVFKDFPISCAGKTGTAERTGRINPADEVAYVKKYLGSIAPGLSWTKVEKEMSRLMKKYPDVYTSRDVAVRKAITNLSNATTDTIDQFKGEYDNFAWMICLAPADDPKIAVAVMTVQGGESLYVGPIVREIVGDYMNAGKSYNGNYNIDAGAQ